MKVMFLYQDENMPSSRIRISNLLPELREEGILPYAVQYPKNFPEKIPLFKKMKHVDVVYLQKKLLTPLEASLLRKCARTFVFDFDDAIYFRDDLHDSIESWARQIKFRYLVKRADLVVAGNRILSEYAARINRHVVTIPSAVKTRDIPLKNHEGPHKKSIIGWIGGKGNLHHLEMLSPIFRKLAHDYRIQLHIVCNDTIRIPGVEIHSIPWKLETEGEEVALFDIGVMPLPQNKWTEGKCGFKALQYMAAAVPPVVSDVGVNRDIVEHGKEGFVVSSVDGFYEAIKALIDNKSMRREIGWNARKKAEKSFSVEVVGKKLAGVLRSLQFQRK